MQSTMKLSAVALAMAFSLGGALAQTPGSAAQPGAGTHSAAAKKDDKVASGDRKFIEKAAGGGMFEMQVAQLAGTRAKSPDVKNFASMLVDQHTRANDELTQLANAKGIELPDAPPRDMRREVEQLGRKNGEAFDKAFIQEVGIEDHEKDIKAFEKAGKDVKDPDLKAWVAKTLPTLKEHLAQAQKIRSGGAMDAATMGNKAAGKTGS